MATTITIRNVPSSVRDVLAGRAAEAGQSLQEYMLAEATRLAERPTNAQIVERMRRRVDATGSDVSSADVVEVLRSERARQ